MTSSNTPADIRQDRLEQMRNPHLEARLHKALGYRREDVEAFPIDNPRHGGVTGCTVRWGNTGATSYETPDYKANEAHAIFLLERHLAKIDLPNAELSDHA